MELACDHVEPYSRGGKRDPENIVLACEQCNGVKGDRTTEEWAADILAARESTAAACQSAERGVTA